MRLINIVLLCALVILTSCFDKDDDESNEQPSVIKILNTEISFNADIDGSYNVYKSNMDGTNVVQLTNDVAFDNWWPRVSPNRQKIIYYRAPAAANQDYGQASLWVMNADGSNKQELIPVGTHGWTLQAHAEWSPNGSEFVMCSAISGILHIVKTNSEGNSPVQLTNDGTWNCDPAWSPSGNKIIFNRCITSNCGGAAKPDLEIYTMNADGTSKIQLTSNSLADYDPYYSPDEQTIAWLKLIDPSAFGGVGSWGIYKMNFDGSSQTAVIDDGFISSKPSWHFSGDQLFFHRIDGTTASKWQIFSINIDGTALTKINLPSTSNIEYPTN